AAQVAVRLRPDGGVMAIGMPSLNGLEATRQISTQIPKSRVVILSAHSDDEYVQQLAEAGATGYLIKTTASQDLVMAIREAKKGNAFFSPAISKRLIEHYRQAVVRGEPVKKGRGRLTSREMEVLQLIAEGNHNKQIAEKLFI